MCVYIYIYVFLSLSLYIYIHIYNIIIHLCRTHTTLNTNIWTSMLVLCVKFPYSHFLRWQMWNIDKCLLKVYRWYQTFTAHNIVILKVLELSTPNSWSKNLEMWRFDLSQILCLPLNKGKSSNFLTGILLDFYGFLLHVLSVCYSFSQDPRHLAAWYRRRSRSRVWLLRGPFSEFQSDKWI